MQLDAGGINHRVCVCVCVCVHGFSKLSYLTLFLSKTTLIASMATKAKMHRETTRRQKERKRRRRRREAGGNYKRGRQIEGVWKGRAGTDRKKGTVLWLINLGVLKEKREGNTHFQTSRVIMQTMTQTGEGGREGRKQKITELWPTDIKKFVVRQIYRLWGNENKNSRRQMLSTISQNSTNTFEVLLNNLSALTPTPRSSF